MKYLLYILSIIFLNNLAKIFIHEKLISLINYILIILPIIFRRRLNGIVSDIKTSLVNGLFIGFVLVYLEVAFFGSFGLLLFVPLINIPIKILMTFISSVSEEIFFRNILYRDISEKISVKSSILIVSTVFSIYHIPLYSIAFWEKMVIFIPYFIILGILLQKIYIKYGLIASITTHFIINFKSILLCFLITNITAIMLITIYVITLVITEIK